MRRRLETLLKRIEQNHPPAEWLRAWRSVEVLEQVGSGDARAALRKLAGGAPESELTRAAADALSRMAR